MSEATTLSFAVKPEAQPFDKAMQEVEPPKNMVWSFDPKAGLDAPFHGLVSHFGADIIFDLDEIVLDTPIKAGIRATKVFQAYSSRVGRQDETRDVMTHIAKTIQANSQTNSDDALLPPQAVFRGNRPRG